MYLYVVGIAASASHEVILSLLALKMYRKELNPRFFICAECGSSPRFFFNMTGDSLGKGMTSSTDNR